ncbi:MULTISPECIES: phage tail tape measure protein [Streptomyces]|uniref:Phage tail tape measure protein n=1 Tax=Streptomyces doudnae TaxID=3075536 RepID=A0ABD5ELR4_9ACTN|nr:MULTISPECIES: phage tail tape measure protein [unclassified Streptomyces]MDT0435601.1 phage tail tape measure protein [Streptomyces sp. DSM 41981]MYQ62556.1 phage tail tape measure protein [Streptomyces sp. SID4950]
MGDITQLRATMREARAQVNGTAAGMRQASGTVAAGMARMGRSVSLVGAGAAVASMKMAGDFEAGTMVLHTAAGETLSNLKTVRKGILDVAKDTGTDWHNLTEGMYQIEKAGIRGSNGLKVLKAAAQGAREENASLESVTNAMTSVMASYHLKADKSVQVMNAMKTAAGEGKMTMEEFASSLSTVLPIASANKISFSEVSGALATLTQHGTSAREGTQELASTIRSLASPNQVAVKEMARLGLSSTDVATKMKDVDHGGRGLAGTFDLLSKTVLGKMGKSGTVLLSSFNNTKFAAQNMRKMISLMPPKLQELAHGLEKGTLTGNQFSKAIGKMPASQQVLGAQFKTLFKNSHGFADELKKGGPAAQTYTEAMRKMLGGAIGLNTALQLTGENTDGYNERVHKVRESYNHATKDVEGWDATQKLFNVRLAKAKQTVSVLAIEIGTKLIPVVTAAADWFARHQKVAVALASVIGGVLALAVVAYAAKLTMSVVKPIGSLAKLGVAGVKAGGRIVQGFRSAQVAGSVFSGRAGSFGGALRRAWNSGISGAKAAGRGIKSAGSAAVSFGRTAGLAIGRGGRAAWSGVVAGAQGAGRAMRAAGSAAVTLSRSAGRAAASAGRAAWAGLVGAVRGAGAAMRTAGTAALTLARSVGQATLAAARSAIAWTVQKARLVASTIATRTAAAVQWVLNAAMSANPIMLVVLAIAALVGALILAYNKIGWFRNFCNGAFKAITTAIGWVVDFVKAHWPMLLTLLTGPIGIAVAYIVTHWKMISRGFSNAYRATVNTGRALITWIGGLPGRAKAALSSLATSLGVRALEAWLKFRAATIQKALEAVAWVRGLPGRARKALGPLGSLLTSAGRDMIRGLINGLKSIGVSSVMSGIANSAKNAFKSALGIHSPSKVFRSLGIYINQGLVEGLTGSTAKVKTATKRIETLILQTRNHLTDQRTSSRTRAGRRTNAWVAQKLKALAGVERYVKREDRVMRSLAAKRDATAKKLKDAQKKLADLQKSWTSKRDEIASSVMQGMSVVTASPDEGRSVNSFDVVASMREQARKVAEFTANLAMLRKKGLRADLIDQIASAGVEGGGDTARALAAASKGQVKEVNSLQTSMKAKAKETGAVVADAMYGAGIKAAQGLVKGLQRQEKAIEKQMVRIAKKMAAAIRHALRIKSPSQVFADIGGYIPQGLAVGITGAARHAVTAAKRLSTQVTSASSISQAAFSANASSYRIPAQRSGSYTYVDRRTVKVEVRGHVMTERELVKVVEEGFLKKGMRNSSTYPAYKR